MKTILVLTFAIACAAATILALPSEASAQASRTWVSGVGDDVNPCSRTAPCKTFAGAISKTATGGVIDVLDPGGFGPVTITKSITIRAVGAEGGITAFTATGGVLINAPGGQVSLVGLNIDAVSGATTGVKVVDAAQVSIANCRIQNFKFAAPAAAVQVASANVTRVTIKDTELSGSLIGLDVAAAGTQVNTVILDNVLLDANPTANIRLAGGKSRVTMRRSTALGSPILLTGSAELRSFGDNAISGGGPTQTDPLQ